MENQRFFLVIALAFVLFLIWDAWQQEQRAKLEPPPDDTVVSTPERGESVPTAPTDTAGPRPDTETVPGSVPLAPDVAAQPQLQSVERVRVVTDLMNVEIDTRGGDIRHLALRTYSQSVDQPDQPFVLLSDAGRDLYVVQSGLVSNAGNAPNHYEVYTAEAGEYRLDAGEDRLVVPLTWTDESGITVTKRYIFHRDRFVIDLEHEISNASGEPWRGVQYRQMQRRPPQESRGLFGAGAYTYTGGVISTPERRYEKIDFGDIAEQELDLRVAGGWVAMIQHYFVTALVPPSQEEENLFYSKALDDNRYLLGMRGATLSEVAPGESTVIRSQIYAGPKVQGRLENVAPHLELTVDYGYLTIIAQPLFWLLSAIHGIVNNWGWSIVLLTVLIKLVFFKLSETSYRSMANMRKLAPQMQRLKDRYGDDRQKLNQAMMELYKTEKVNPLGGCLPILVQIPVFIALYWMLLESVELRQAPWILWIEDLSIRDPYYILPLIMGASMFLQQRLNPTPPDPVQAKVMMALPVVFTVFFLWFPAGLVLYWVVNNTLSIAQQYVITKRVEAAGAKA